MIVRKPTLNDIDQIKSIADSNRDSLGFVIIGELLFSIERKWMFVIDIDSRIRGFINYRHRKDNVTTVYRICVESQNRRKGYGSLLMDAVVEEAKNYRKKEIRLKSLIKNESNGFYKNYGFEIISKEKNKQNIILIWQYLLK